MYTAVCSLSCDGTVFGYSSCEGYLRVCVGVYLYVYMYMWTFLSLHRIVFWVTFNLRHLQLRYNAFAYVFVYWNSWSRQIDVVFQWCIYMIIIILYPQVFILFVTNLQASSLNNFSNWPRIDINCFVVLLLIYLQNVSWNVQPTLSFNLKLYLSFRIFVS